MDTFEDTDDRHRDLERLLQRLVWLMHDDEPPVPTPNIAVMTLNSWAVARYAL
ncbi:MULTISPECIES: hypothetical protein [unclassified Kitasatospora]|uniref:hypothetical protein n=1 Tax=unclassified Kitasatospora TaxID=2633591 RepID=UPI000A7FEE40|nr:MULTISPECIES: hypothetical protein [unclassified Kitasatospora]